MQPQVSAEAGEGSQLLDYSHTWFYLYSYNVAAQVVSPEARKIQLRSHTLCNRVLT